MMVFDPFNWAFAFTLTQIANRTLQWFRSDSLLRALNEEAKDWADNLPCEFDDLSPDALLNTIFTEDYVSSDGVGPKRDILRKLLENKQIPRQRQWSDALLERWFEIREGLGDQAQKFFQTDQTNIQHLIDDLARRFESVCARDEDLFKVTIYHALNQVLMSVEDLGSTKQDIRNEEIDKEQELYLASKDKIHPISFAPNNRMGRNVVLGESVKGATLRKDGKFYIRLAFYIKLRNRDFLRRLYVRYYCHRPNLNNKIYPSDRCYISIDREEPPIYSDGILHELYELSSEHWYSVRYDAILWAFDSNGEIVFPDHPRFRDVYPPQDGTDYGKGEINLECMESQLNVQFFLNPGGIMLLTEDGWIGPHVLLD
jgi:hypothetical protein